MNEGNKTAPKTAKITFNKKSNESSRSTMEKTLTSG